MNTMLLVQPILLSQYHRRYRNLLLHCAITPPPRGMGRVTRATSSLITAQQRWHELNVPQELGEKKESQPQCKSLGIMGCSLALLKLIRIYTLLKCRYSIEPKATFPPSEKGKKQAVEAATTLGRNDFGESTGSLASRGDSRVFKCITHVDCSARTKVVFVGTGPNEGYWLHSSLAEHALVRKSLPAGFKGISAEFVEEVDEMLGKGHSPNQVLAELTLLCGEDQPRKLRLPRKDKLAAYRKKLENSPRFKFETVADMLAWANVPGRRVVTREEFDAVEDEDKLLVFDTFYFIIRVKDESEGAAEGATVEAPTFGFNFGSKRTVKQLGQVRR